MGQLWRRAGSWFLAPGPRRLACQSNVWMGGGRVWRDEVTAGPEVHPENAGFGDKPQALFVPIRSTKSYLGRSSSGTGSHRPPCQLTLGIFLTPDLSVKPPLGNEMSCPP